MSTVKNEMARLKMIEWYEKAVFPLCLFDGDGYWGKCFTMIANPPKPACLLFSMTNDPETTTYDIHSVVKRVAPARGTIVPTAQMMRPLMFWDCVLTAFMLYWPEAFTSSEVVAKAILRDLESWGYHPTQILNFDATHWDWLVKVSNGEQKLQMLSRPLECTIYMVGMLEFYAKGGIRHRIQQPRPKAEIPVLGRQISKPLDRDLVEMKEWMVNGFGKITVSNKLNAIKFRYIATEVATRWEAIFGPIQPAEQKAEAK